MGGYRGVWVVLVALLAACSSPKHHQWDLSRGRYIYRSPGFEAPVQKSQSFFIRPMQDKREMPATPRSSVYASYMPDQNWARPPVVMVEEIFRREVADAQIYQDAAHDANSADIVVEPTLVALVGVYETGAEEGSRTYATTAIHLKVLGPRDASGTRKVWMDRVFRHTASSPPVRFNPMPVNHLTGRALRDTMAKLLDALYRTDGPAKAPSPDAQKN
jgi:hypothetical protein